MLALDRGGACNAWWRAICPDLNEQRL